MKQISVLNQTRSLEFIFYDNANGVILRDFEGFEHPEIRPVIENIAGVGGGAYITSRFGSRVISWSGDLVGDPATIFTLRRQMLAPFTQEGTLKLIKFTTYDDLLLQCEAEIIKVVAPYTHSIHNYLIEAKCPDWRFFSQNLYTYLTGETTVLGGMAIPAKVPYDLQAGINSNNLFNVGTEISDPIFTITGPGTGFTVGNTTTGESFYIDLTLTGTDSIVVDIAERTVMQNTIFNVFSNFTGDFWRLVPGNNNLRFVINSGANSNTKLSVQYRAAYNGI